RLREAQEKTLAALADSDRHRQQTQQMLEKVQAQHEVAQRLSTRLALDRGLNLCEQGNLAPGVLWLARSMQIAPPGAADMQWAIRANLGAWSAQLHTLDGLWEQPGAVRALHFRPDGKTVVAATADAAVRIRDVTRGQPVGAPVI